MLALMPRLTTAEIAVNIGTLPSTRVLVLGRTGRVGSQLLQHALMRGFEPASEGTSATDLVIGCQFEFQHQELRRAQRMRAPRLAFLISPETLSRDGVHQAALEYGRSQFKMFDCPVWIMRTPAPLGAFDGWTPERMAANAIDTSIRMME